MSLGEPLPTQTLHDGHFMWESPTNWCFKAFILCWIKHSQCKLWADGCFCFPPGQSQVQCIHISSLTVKSCLPDGSETAIDLCKPLQKTNIFPKISNHYFKNFFTNSVMFVCLFVFGFWLKFILMFMISEAMCFWKCKRPFNMKRGRSIKLISGEYWEWNLSLYKYKSGNIFFFIFSVLW